MANVVILFIVALYSAFVIKKLYKDKKRGICTGCSTKSCASCSRFNDEYFDSLIKEAKRNKDGAVY